jgi:hypothetical protein
MLALGDPGWAPNNEYDPLWPNDYYKVVQDMKETKRQFAEEEDAKQRRQTDRNRYSGRKSDSDGEDDERGGRSRSSRNDSRRSRGKKVPLARLVMVLSPTRVFQIFFCVFDDFFPNDKTDFVPLIKKKKVLI